MLLTKIPPYYFGLDFLHSLGKLPRLKKMYLSGTDFRAINMNCVFPFTNSMNLNDFLIVFISHN